MGVVIVPQQEHNNRTDIYNHACSEKCSCCGIIGGGTMLEQFDFMGSMV